MIKSRMTDLGHSLSVTMKIKSRTTDLAEAEQADVAREKEFNPVEASASFYCTESFSFYSFKLLFVNLILRSELPHVVTFSCLHGVVLDRYKMLKEIPSELRDIPTLEMIKILKMYGPARNRENEIDTLSEVKDSFESGPELPLPLTISHCDITSSYLPLALIQFSTSVCESYGGPGLM
ncbi:hypothetical protein C3L33_17235, partial [Rhododendron williamsianum]